MVCSEVVLSQTDRGCLRRCVCIPASSCHTYIISHTQARTYTHTHTHTVKVKVGDGSDSVVGLWFRLASSRLYFCLSLSPCCSQHNSDRRVCVVRVCVRNNRKRIYLSIHLSILLELLFFTRLISDILLPNPPVSVSV